MKFIKTDFEGVLLVQPTPYEDHRGLLRRHYCHQEFNDAGFEFTVLQTNISENPERGTLRGFHLQLPPYGEKKIVSCLRGRIYGIVLDLRPGSNTFRNWMSYDICCENRRSLVIPEGCANAYMTLDPITWIFYCHSQYYSPSHEFGIRYDDPYFEFSWPNQPALISQKDLGYPAFAEKSYLKLVNA